MATFCSFMVELLGCLTTPYFDGLSSGTGLGEGSRSTAAGFSVGVIGSSSSGSVGGELERSRTMVASDSVVEIDCEVRLGSTRVFPSDCGAEGCGTVIDCCGGALGLEFCTAGGEAGARG